MSTPPRSRLLAGLAGLLSAALALGVAELVAAVVHPNAAPVVAVGSAVIDGSPSWLKEFAIRVFGTYDKIALLAGILVLLAAGAAAIGHLARRRQGAAVACIAAFGIAGAAAAASRADATWVWTVPSLLGAGAGMTALPLLVPGQGAGSGEPGTAPYTQSHAVAPGSASPSSVEAGEGSSGSAPLSGSRDGTAGTSTASAGGTDRRGFLLLGAGIAAVAGTAGGLGRVLSGRRHSVTSSRAAVTLPPPDDPALAVPRGADLDVAGVVPFFTPNATFYRVDTALVLPSVPPEDWMLRVHGMVDRELTLTFEQLLARPLIERDITLACVSNPVGGTLVGNARWLGVRLADLLREAGVRSGADELLSRSADGWTCGTPTATVMDGRDAMLAVAMNGKPLPVAHGFPVRMVVPGLYGYVSATKWLVDIELTRFARKKPYWATRGWALRAPVETMARIDTPAPGNALTAGRVPVAGVAWAQHRGIRRVEVRVDGGPWRRARLAPVPSADTWRQWVHYWDAAPGEHELQVRATDGRGRVQTGTESPPAPDGATGWHTVRLTVD